MTTPDARPAITDTEILDFIETVFRPPQKAGDMAYTVNFGFDPQLMGWAVSVIGAPAPNPQQAIGVGKGRDLRSALSEAIRMVREPVPLTLVAQCLGGDFDGAMYEVRSDMSVFKIPVRRVAAVVTRGRRKAGEPEEPASAPLYALYELEAAGVKHVLKYLGQTT